MSDSSHIKSTKVSVGLPVYNGGKFIQRRLDSILNQTFTDFELIISDNASNDATSKICQEYIKKDKKIRYFRQNKNIGIVQNWNFVLQQAKYEYFVWASVDDLWHPNFLEKNIKILSSKKNVVCSIGNISEFDSQSSNFYSIKNNSNTTSIMKKLRNIFRKINMHTLSGSYEEKIKDYLNSYMCNVIYGVFRTDELRKSYVVEEIGAYDWATNLNILKFGDVHVIDEILLKKYQGGLSSNTIGYLSHFNSGLSLLFPNYPITSWFVRNIGFRLFLRNFGYFIGLNFSGIASVVYGLILFLSTRYPKKIKT